MTKQHTPKRRQLQYKQQEAQLSLTNRAMLVCKVVEVWHMFIRFDMIHECDRQTYRRTDRQTDRRTPHDGIDRAYA